MNNMLDINQLLSKPIAMMTGEELTFLIKNCASNNNPSPTIQQQKNYYGIEGIAQVFGCSVPTANRIKKSGVIDDAITQIGRKIIIDAEKALALVKAAKLEKRM